MNEIATNSNVVSAGDWRKVSVALIRNNGGEVVILIILCLIIL